MTITNGFIALSVGCIIILYIILYIDISCSQRGLIINLKLYFYISKYLAFGRNFSELIREKERKQQFF